MEIQSILAGSIIYQLADAIINPLVSPPPSPIEYNPSIFVLKSLSIINWFEQNFISAAYSKLSGCANPEGGYILANIEEKVETLIFPYNLIFFAC